MRPLHKIPITELREELDRTRNFLWVAVICGRAGKASELRRRIREIIERLEDDIHHHD